MHRQPINGHLANAFIQSDLLIRSKDPWVKGLTTLLETDLHCCFLTDTELLFFMFKRPITFMLSHLADAFIQSNLQMRIFASNNSK